MFLQIVLCAKQILMNLLKKQKQSPKPQINVDITEFRKMQNLKQELNKQVQIIKRIENKELPELLQHSDNLKGKFKTKEKKKVDKQIEVMQDRKRQEQMEII